MMHMKHMKFEKGFFERTAGANAFQRMGTNSFHRPQTLEGVKNPRREEFFSRRGFFYALMD